MPASLRSFTDAAADAVAREIASLRRESARERELQAAEYRARVAELDARIASVAALERQVQERLASLKDGEPGRDGQDGASLTLDDVAPMIAEAVERAVSAMPAPKDGRDGVDGAPGRDGEPGKEGPEGKLPIVREWSDVVHYEGEVVTHDGATYQALRDTAKQPPHDDWRCIASAGRDGRSFSIRGTYADGEEYRALDVVALNGASFAARYDNPGACPGDGWQLIAAQGKRGAPGERGAPGGRGEAGPKIERASVDDEGLLVIVNADGSRVECDFYDVLRKLG
jgi:hypothetical protein